MQPEHKWKIDDGGFFYAGKLSAGWFVPCVFFHADDFLTFGGLKG